MAITNEIDKLVEATANKYGVPVNLVRTLIAAESGGLKKNGDSAKDFYWNANPNAVSPAGAIGLMQLMPETAKGLGVNPRTIEGNIEGGVKYLKQQLDAQGGDVRKALASYNAGPGAVAKHNGVPPYRETVDYVNKITNGLRRSFGQPVSESGQMSPVTPANQSTVDASQTQSGTTQAPAGTAQDAANSPAYQGIPSTADEAARLQSAYSATADAYGTSAQASAAAQANIQRMAAGMPDIAGTVKESLAQSNAALSNMSQQSRAAIDQTFAAIEQKDVARRAIMQSMMADKNLDPTVQGSIADMSTDNLAMLNRRMNATILAEQATNEMSVLDNPAGFFEKVIFGNLYTKGRQELSAQFNDLKTVTTGTREEVTAQGKWAADTKIGDPALDKMKLDATLKMAELDKDVAVAQAEIPVKVVQAQVDAMKAQAQMMGYAVDYGRQAADATANQQQQVIASVTAPLDVAGKQANVTAAQTNAAVGLMDLETKKKYYAADTQLMEIELNAKTDVQKAAALEARAALNAAIATASTGQMDAAALQKAMTAINTANIEWRGSTATASSAVPEKEVTTREAELDRVANEARAKALEADPKFEQLKRDATAAQYNSAIFDYQAKVGEAEAIKNGAIALGLDNIPDVSRLNPEVKNIITAIGAGQPAGVNPGAAALNVVSLGVAAAGTGLTNTAQAVLKLPTTSTDKTGEVVSVPLGQLKPDDMNTLTASSVLAAVEAQRATTHDKTNAFSTEQIYGLVPTTVLLQTPDLLTSDQKINIQLAQDIAAEDKTGLANTSLRGMALALVASDKISIAQVPNVLASIAQASTTVNNATRKYQVLGLEKQDGFTIAMADKWWFDGLGEAKLNIKDPADAAKYMMYLRADAARGKIRPDTGVLFSTPADDALRGAGVRLGGSSIPAPQW